MRMQYDDIGYARLIEDLKAHTMRHFSMSDKITILGDEIAAITFVICIKFTSNFWKRNKSCMVFQLYQSVVFSMVIGSYLLRTVPSIFFPV